MLVVVYAKMQYFYTFKVVSQDGEPFKVDCMKWEEATGEGPVEIYHVKPEHQWMACSCPAYRKCKHQKCVEELLEDGKIQELWKWRWDEKKGWQPLDDIQPIEEFL